VIGVREVWLWRRPREPATLDWRQIDSDGTGFVQFESDALVQLARDLTAGLGLTMSVQDWLETKDGPVFLESNSQGAWMFLSGSESMVSAAVARHLVG
jgi:hypothetical protein